MSDLECENDFMQVSQVYGFIPVCVGLCGFECILSCTTSDL